MVIPVSIIGNVNSATWDSVNGSRSTWTNVFFRNRATSASSVTFNTNSGGQATWDDSSIWVGSPPTFTRNLTTSANTSNANYNQNTLTAPTTVSDVDGTYLQYSGTTPYPVLRYNAAPASYTHISLPWSMQMDWYATAISGSTRMLFSIGHSYISSSTLNWSEIHVVILGAGNGSLQVSWYPSGTVASVISANLTNNNPVVLNTWNRLRIMIYNDGSNKIRCWHNRYLVAQSSWTPVSAGAAGDVTNNGASQADSSNTGRPRGISIGGDYSQGTSRAFTGYIKNVWIGNGAWFPTTGSVGDYFNF